MGLASVEVALVLGSAAGASLEAVWGSEEASQSVWVAAWALEEVSPSV
jgi:hypothetical protein